jgi:hypothetical protein
MTEAPPTRTPEGTAAEQAQRLYRHLRRYSIATIAAYVIATFAQGLVGAGGLAAASGSSGLGAIGLLFGLVYFVMFLVTMATARHFGEAIGLSGYQWSLRWNLISCFIPLLNFVRPWLGFGEIYRSLINSAKSRVLDGSWNRGFSWLTFLMALLVILNLTVLRSRELDRPMMEHPFVALALSLAMLAIPIVYFVRIRRAARHLYALYTTSPQATAAAPSA